MATTRTTTFDVLGFMMDLEDHGDKMSQATLIRGMQALIDRNMIAHLQGFYGRLASDLYEAGLVHPNRQ